MRSACTHAVVTALWALRAGRLKSSWLGKLCVLLLLLLSLWKAFPLHIPWQNYFLVFKATLWRKDGAFCQNITQRALECDFVFWVGVPWETSCNAVFLSLLGVAVLRGCWMMASVTLGRLPVGNLQSFVFLHILFLGHLLATYCTYALATRTL